jgi:hypothetical protein
MASSAPVNISTMTTLSAAKATTIEEIKAFYDAYYTPERIKEINAAYTTYKTQLAQEATESKGWVQTGWVEPSPIQLEPVGKDPSEVMGCTFCYSSGLFTPF